MMWISRLLRRTRHFAGHRKVEQEMDEEMRLHLELEVEERMASGMSSDEARRTALRDFGGVERFKEEARDARGVRPVQDLAQDLRYVGRTLARTPGFTAAAVATLALGIAATTVIVSLVNAIFLRPLPVHEPDRLFIVNERWSDGRQSTDVAQPVLPYGRYLEYLRDAPPVFESVAGYRFTALSLRSGELSQTRSGSVTSTNYFRVLGVQPALGRFFSEVGTGSDDAQPEVVLAWDLWEREFGRDPQVVGSTLYVDSRAYTVVGIAPRGFHGAMTGLVSELWVPAAVFRVPPLAPGASADAAPRPRSTGLTIFGRLPAGITVAAATARLTTWVTAVGEGERTEGQGAAAPERVVLDPLNAPPAMAAGGLAAFLTMLAITAGLVMLIAATNVAGMLLARATHRRREIGVRLALGAARGRLLRQLLTESLAICLLGAVLGVILAALVVALVPALDLPFPVRVAIDLTLDPLVLVIAVAVGVGAGVLAGITPALQSTRQDAMASLRGGDGERTVRRSRLRSTFVVVQLALSLVLLFTAGLFGRALQRGLAVDPGLDASGVVTGRVDFGPHGYDAAAALTLAERMRERIVRSAGVESAAYGTNLPLSGSFAGNGVRLPHGDGEPRFTNVMYAATSPGWLATVRAPLLLGRDLAATDGPDAPPVAVVNETMARRFWPDAPALGQTFELLSRTITVVGVVADGHYRSLNEQRPENFAFLPYAQSGRTDLAMYVRGRGDLATTVLAMREALAEVNPNVAFAGLQPMERQIAVYVLPQRVAAWLIGAFGAIGLLLAAIGIYGVLAFQVAQRTREFGVRMALGARQRDVLGLVMRQALLLVAIGTASGLALALLVGRIGASFLYGVSPTDPVTLAAVPLVLATSALLAAWQPASRASRVPPALSLRTE